MKLVVLARPKYLLPQVSCKTQSATTRPVWLIESAQSWIVNLRMVDIDIFADFLGVQLYLFDYPCTPLYLSRSWFTQTRLTHTAVRFTSIVSS